MLPERPRRVRANVRADRAALPTVRDLLEAVLTVHAGALVHVGLGYVGAPTTGDALLDTLADKTAHQEGTALYAPVGLGVPGDLLRLRQDSPLSLLLWSAAVFYRRVFGMSTRNNEYRGAGPG